MFVAIACNQPLESVGLPLGGVEHQDGYVTCLQTQDPLCLEMNALRLDGFSPHHRGVETCRTLHNHMDGLEAGGLPRYELEDWRQRASRHHDVPGSRSRWLRTARLLPRADPCATASSAGKPMQ
jgi:hypothetical protein